MTRVHKGRVFNVIFPQEGPDTTQGKFLPSLSGQTSCCASGEKRRFFSEQPREEFSVKPEPLGAFNECLLDF